MTLSVLYNMVLSYLQSPEGQDPSPPGLDIDWNLPDFGSIG